MTISYFDKEAKQEYLFGDLPIGAQKAIAGRWFIEFGYFFGGKELTEEISVFLPDTINEENYAKELSKSQWEAILLLIKDYYGDKTFTYFEASTERVKEIVLKSMEDYNCWEDYASDYGGRILHSKENRFACLSSLGDDEIFEDGWNRLHSYINQGHATIPIVEY
jgi:hypothetical protein